MKNRWLLNLVMLALVGGLVAFLYFRPQKTVEAAAAHEITQLKLGDFNQIKAEFPTQTPLMFEKEDGLWRMTSPYKTRADQMSVNRILSIIAAQSPEKFPTTDLAKYGLDNPELVLKLTNSTATEVFTFGTHNPVTDEQYVSFKDAVYLLPVSYAESASTQAIEMVDKSPLSPLEAKQIVGFNFGFLEQWQELGGLDVSLEKGNWKVSLPKTKITQNEMNEWLDFSWKQAFAKSVEMYTPDRQAKHPSLEVLLADGKKVHFDKIQESPELILARPDEGILYHIASDAGFTMLNPPMSQQK